MQDNLLRLAARVEQLAGADPVIDRLIERLLPMRHATGNYALADDAFGLEPAPVMPAYTALFEVALTLLPTDCRLAMLADRPDGEGWYCSLDRSAGPTGSYVARSSGAASPALALVAATLRQYSAMTAISMAA